MKNVKLLFLIFFVLFRIITFAQPTIISFAPTNGPVGTTVTINGTNFNVTPANNIVFFGATMATVISASSSSLTVIVPLGATYQNISVTDLTTGLTAYSAHPFVTTFDCGTINSTSFAPKTDYNTGNGPWGVAIADFDGDGKSDIAVADQGSDTVSVFRNISTSGAISFASKVGFKTGAMPLGVSISDLNGDGKPDIAVANSSSTTISVYKNTCISGIISFEPKVDYTVGSSPWNISIGDLDNDGKPDIAVANDGSSSVSILRNNSTGGMISFAIKEDYASGINPGVSMGDLDGDERLDLAVVSFGSNSFSVFKNTSTIGNISFDPKVDYSTGIGPNDISIVDFDGDGKQDIAVLNKSSNTVSIFRNTSIVGIISFAPKVDYTTVNGPSFFAIGDLDGDGKPDLAFVDASFVSVFRNICSIGTISFAPKVDYDIGSDSYSHVAIGDLDGDGKPDLVVSSHNTNKVSVLRNISENNFVTPSVSITTSTTNICAGNLTTFTATPSNGGFSPAYQWKLNGLNVGVNSPTYSNSTLINNDVIICEMTSSITCTTTPTVTSNLLNITVNPLPTVNAGNDVTICTGNSTVLNATGASSYFWAPPNGLSSTTGSSVTANPTSTTTYYVTGTDMNGCTNTDNVVVTVTSSLSPTINGSTSICTGEPTTLTVTGNYSSYLWSNSANTNSITVNISGNYSVTVTNYSGCTGTAQITITDSPKPFASFMVQSYCVGQNTVFTNTSTIISPDFYIWNFGDGSESTEFSPSHMFENSGNYNVYLVAFSQNGCRDTSDIVSVPVNPAPDIFITSQNNDTVLNNGGEQIMLFGNGAGNYLWVGGSTNQSISVYNPGIYWVIGTTPNGCQGTDSITIYQNNNYNNDESSIILASSILTPNGDGINECLTISNLQDYWCCNIEIYDIWNRKVFWTDNCYNNSWDCRLNGNGNILPDGAYYYIINCGMETKKGNINILTNNR